MSVASIVRENFFTLLFISKNFLLEKGQLAESIYDLIINKRHLLGLFSRLALNLK